MNHPIPVHAKTVRHRFPFLLSIVAFAFAALDVRAQALERRSQNDIQQAFKRIEAAARQAVPGNRDHERALALLNKYRYLCGVPHDVVLKKEYTDLAQAAAEICARLGALNHHPPNPGWPEKEYRPARTGAEQSNLSMGSDIPGSVLMYMHDSDPSNISRVGHRRWCLDPAMRFTGFGISGRFSAMHVMDGSRETEWSSDFIAFPPPGLMPADLISPSHAWHVSLNPMKYAPPDKSEVKVSVLPLRRGDLIPKLLVPSAQSLKLNAFYVDGGVLGGSGAIIFRADGIRTQRGQRYAVILHGLRDNQGEPATLSYAVEFF